MRIFLANPRGFCAGVNRAINILEKVIEIYGVPIYVYHEIVHNKYVIENFKNSGVIFTENIKNIPENSTLVLSAHGVSKEIINESKERNLTIFDATCFLVSRIHMEVNRASKCGMEVIIIGDSKHPEVIGTIGRYENTHGNIYLIESDKDAKKLEVQDPNLLCLVTQTTLSLKYVLHITNILRTRFPNIKISKNSNVCFATKNRQNAIYDLAKNVDIILVIGSNNSSNANKLVELSKSIGKQSYLIDNIKKIKKNWFKHVNNIGIISGASTPEILVKKTINYLKKFNISEIEEMKGIKEKVFFDIPESLKIKTRNI